MSGVKRKKCNICYEKTGKERALHEFYKSDSIMFSDGLVPVCKRCLKENVDSTDIDSVKGMLQKIDKPFIAKAWKDAEDKGGDVFGNYIRVISSLPQYKEYKSWSDSVFAGEESTKIYKNKYNNIDNITKMNTDEGVIELTDEVRLKFGSGFSNLEYLQMEKFYKEMDRTHDINTPQLRKQIINMCKLQVMMDRCLENGNAVDYKKYADSYDDILKTGGLAPKDKKSLSDSAGIRSFGQVFEEVEKNGFIEPYPIEENIDLVELCLREYINYVRVLNGVGRIDRVPEDIMERLEDANGKIV